MLSKVCEPKNEKVTEGIIKLYNQELLDLCSPPHTFRTIKSRRTRRKGHVRQYGGEYELMQDSGGETLRKAKLPTFRTNLEDKINAYLKEMGWEGAEWINLVQDKGRGVAHTVGIIEFHTMRRIS